MKKAYKFLPAVVCAVVMLATSCTEDDQPIVPEDPDTEVPTPPAPGDNSEKLLTGTVIGTRYSVDYDSLGIRPHCRRCFLCIDLFHFGFSFFEDL